MGKIIKIHGCSGAGKTTVARAFMMSSDVIHEVVPDLGKKPEAYVLERRGYDAPVCVLGSYKNNCGGMDSFPSDAPSIIKLIDHYRGIGHVLFEGLLMSTYYGAVGKHLEQYGDDVILAFMDTPLLVCLERITTRRDVQQSKNKFNPQNTVDKFKTIEKLKNKCIDAGRRVVSIPYQGDSTSLLNQLFLDAS